MNSLRTIPGPLVPEPNVSAAANVRALQAKCMTTTITRARTKPTAQTDGHSTAGGPLHPPNIGHLPVEIGVFGAVTIGKSSVRNGDAGSPSLFQRFTTG